TVRSKYLTDYYSTIIRLIDFKRNTVATNGNAYFDDGYDVAYNAVHRLYVSIGKYALSASDNCQCSTVKMVLHHRKINNDKGFGLFCHLERNAYPVWNDLLFADSEYQKI